MLVGGGLLVVAGLSLSDQAPRLVADLLMTLPRILGVRGGGLTSAVQDQIPLGLDTIGHGAVWGVVGFMAAGTVRSARHRITLLSALFFLSALFEAGQQYLSWSRSASLSDLVANGVGLMIGMLAFAIVERAFFAVRQPLRLRT